MFKLRVGEKKFRNVLEDTINNPQSCDDHIQTLYELKTSLVANSNVKECSRLLIQIINNYPLDQKEVNQLVGLVRIECLEDVKVELILLNIKLLVRGRKIFIA